MTLDDASIDGERFKVLVNDEQAYSLWPAGKQAPAGWRAVGPVGSKIECLAYVEKVWPNLCHSGLKENGQPACSIRPKPEPAQ